MDDAFACTVQVYIAMLLNKYKIRDVYVYCIQCTCFRINVQTNIYIVLWSSSYISIQKDDNIFQFWFLPSFQTAETLKHLNKAKMAINSFSSTVKKTLLGIKSLLIKSRHHRIDIITDHWINFKSRWGVCHEPRYRSVYCAVVHVVRVFKYKWN